jgi:hypothetical protein
MKKSLFVVLSGMFVSLGLHAQQKFFPQALVELYSSEGCENCPFADAFTKEIIHIADSFHQAVYVIDFHVDIWNRSGWVDPFSDSTYTARQLKAAQRVGQQAIFTPMMFVNGQGGLPGGAKKEVGSYIRNALKEPREHNLVTNAQLFENTHTLSIDYDITGNIDSMEIHFALVRNEIKQHVTSGDNKGKILEHHHVVRQFATDVVKVRKGHYELPLPSGGTNLKDYQLISFLQRKGGGYVLAVDELLFH